MRAKAAEVSGPPAQLFFYGTLLDPDVRGAVLGARAGALNMEPAALLGFCRVRARRGGYPVLVRRGGRRVHGQLAGGLDSRALFAIANFEGSDYEPRRVVVIDAAGRRRPAWVFLAQHTRLRTRQPWSLARWQLRHKPRLLPQIRRWMTEYGADTLQSYDIRWHVRRRLVAMARAAGSGS